MIIDLAEDDIPENLKITDENGIIFTNSNYRDHPSYRNTKKIVRNLEIIGNDRLPNSVGIRIENAPFLSFENLVVQGFYHSVEFGNNTWCNSFFNSNFYNCSNLINYKHSFNSGENIRFFGCTFFNSDNVAIIDHGANLNFFGCAFDYNKNGFIITNAAGASVVLNTCHIEHDNSNVFVDINNKAGSFTINDSTIFLNNQANPHLIGKNKGCVILNNLKIFNYNKRFLQIGRGKISTRNIQFLNNKHKIILPKNYFIF